MSCEQVRECVHEHLEGVRHPMELACRLPAWAQRHLQGCAACRDAACELVALEAALPVLADYPPEPPDLTAAVMARVQTSKPPAETGVARPFASRAWGLVAAALLAVIGAGSLGYGAESVGGLVGEVESWLQLGWMALSQSWAPASLVPAWQAPGLPEFQEAAAAALAAVFGLASLAMTWRWSAVH